MTGNTGKASSLLHPVERLRQYPLVLGQQWRNCVYIRNHRRHGLLYISKYIGVHAGGKLYPGALGPSPQPLLS